MARDAVETEKRRCTVLVADAQVAMRAGIRRALSAQDLTTVAEASDATEAVRGAQERRPDVCLLAFDLPGGGITAARQIHESLPQTRILMLNGVHRDEDLFASLRAGAHGYLLKSTSAERLPNAVLGLLSGEAVIPRRLAARLVDEFRDSGGRRTFQVSIPGRTVEFTAREFEVLEHLRSRSRTASVAQQMGISEVTVRRHISSMLGKLGVNDRRRMMELLEGQ